MLHMMIKYVGLLYNYLSQLYMYMEMSAAVKFLIICQKSDKEFLIEMTI
jgi:hypothetical protein